MKIKKILLTIILSALWYGVLFSQNVVKDTSNVKRPIVGKLYYQKTDNNLYLYRNGFELASVPSEEPTAKPDVLNEMQIGHWDSQNRILVLFPIEGKYYLMQRDGNFSYYVARGKNLLNDPRTVLTRIAIPAIESGESGLGGLQKPSNFPESKFLALGYEINANGEYVKIGTNPTPEPSNKIKIPVGLIMWDNWEHDYWNETNDMDKLLINHISRNRYSATFWGDKFDLVPFYGQHTSPEKIMIRYNVKWDPQLGKNTYDSLQKEVRVKFDKSPADTEREVKYYRDAGFDFMAFNYYSDDSYLSETRRDFVAMQNKLGMKMTFKLQNGRRDSEIDYITTLMTKDYWFNIDNKPVLYLNDGDFVDLPKYKNSLKAKNGKDIYVVYYGFNGYPGDWGDYQAKRNDAISAYNTTIGGYSTHEQLIVKEVSDRNNWMAQFKATHVKLIPILSLGLENLDLRTDMGSGGKPVGIIEAANLDQVNRKNDLIKDFIKQYPDKVPAILWYSGNEILEGGKSLVPKKLKNGTIDTSILDTISKHLE